MFVVIEFPGSAQELEIAEFETYEEARKFANLMYQFDPDEMWDIMYRKPDGNLTSDF